MSDKTPEDRIFVPLMVLISILAIYATYMVHHG